MFYKAMLKKKNNKKAFTLIELIVVIAIIGVLIAILVPTLSGFVGQAQKNTNSANARTVYGVAQAQLQFILSSGGTVSAKTWDAASAAANDFISQVTAQVPVSPGANYKVYVTSSAGNTWVSKAEYISTASASPVAYPS